LPYHLSRPRRI